MLVCLNSYTGIMPPHCPQGHDQPKGNNHIDPRYSADALKAISNLHLGSCPKAILKIWQPSSLVYRPGHGVLPNTVGFTPSEIQDQNLNFIGLRDSFT